MGNLDFQRKSLETIVCSEGDRILLNGAPGVTIISDGFAPVLSEKPDVRPKNVLRLGISS